MRWLVRLAICTGVLVVMPLFNFPAPSPARAAGTQSPSCQLVMDALEEPGAFSSAVRVSRRHFDTGFSPGHCALDPEGSSHSRG